MSKRYWVAVALLPVLAACGEEPPRRKPTPSTTPTYCAGFNGCGGTLAGNWTYKATCDGDWATAGNPWVLDGETPPAGCQGSNAYYGSTPTEISMTYVISAASTYRLDQSITLTVEERYSDGCLAALDARPPSEFCELIESSQRESVPSYTCTHAAAQCSCGVTTQATATENGTYATFGNSVMWDPNEGNAYETQYCVQGSLLRLAESQDPTYYVFQK